jgi:hypothetical protein
MSPRGIVHAMDEGAAVGGWPMAAGGSSGSTGSLFNVSPVSAAAYNSMAAMNHMYFECGVDLKATLKIGRKRLLKGLLAAPDSPNALSLGYVVYTTAH